MKKVVLVVIIALGVSMPNVMNAQSSNDKILDLLPPDEEKEYVSQLVFARACIERAISQNKFDTLCMPYMSQIDPDPVDTVNFTEKGISLRDSIVYMYASTQEYLSPDTNITDSMRIGIHNGYLYRREASGPYKKQLPVFKCEEYKKVYDPQKYWQRIRTLTVNALKGELASFGEDFNDPNVKYPSIEMQKYHSTPPRIFSFIFTQTKK